ncbi:MAG: PAS domain S-box protein [Chloroflexi bacterium]|nr:PAS domain S-box protein [Chloroflexota bacterium]MBL7061195.1 PAS domain S-box protein [Dehalococcoidia bacterium]
MADRWRIFNICFITLLFLLLTLSHYDELLVGIPVIADVSITSLLGLSRHAIERFLYILIIIYAGWSLGTKFGIAILLASALVMLPRALFASTNPIDAITESIAALTISGLSISLIQMHRGWYWQKQKLRGIKVALRTSKESYEELFTNASDAIWVHDMDGKMVIANKACEKVTGYPPDELTGKNVSEIMSPDALSIAREIKTKLMKGQSIDQRYDQRFIKKDGSEAIVELFTRLIRVDGKPSAFQNIARDVTEERRLRDNLRLQIHKTLMAQEEERKRIARELHDDVAQSILLLSRRLDILIAGGTHKPPKASVNELEDIQAIANGAYKSLQRYARDLRPSILDQMGLIAALNWLAEELGKELGIKTTVKADKLPPLPSETELAMFRIAQEALNNVRKHAQASKVKFVVESSSSNMRMIVTDNGKGFLTSRLTGNLAKEGKLGILGMEERARLIGGNIQIKSEPGKGTIVIAKAPIQT